METIVDEFDALESDAAGLSRAGRKIAIRELSSRPGSWVMCFPMIGRQVLHAINVKIEHGQFVGIVGRSGTLVNRLSWI